MSNSEVQKILDRLDKLEDRFESLAKFMVEAVAAMKDAASKSFTEAQAARNDVKHLRCVREKHGADCDSVPPNTLIEVEPNVR